MKVKPGEKKKKNVNYEQWTITYCSTNSLLVTKLIKKWEYLHMPINTHKCSKVVNLGILNYNGGMWLKSTHAGNHYLLKKEYVTIC